MVAADLRRSLRGALSGTSLLASLCLAFGLTANISIFCSANALLLRVLPVPHPDELAAAGHLTSEGVEPEFPYPALRFLRGTLTGDDTRLAGWTPMQLVATVRGHSSEIIAEAVTDNYFRVLRVGVLPGQDWYRRGSSDAAPIPVVISHRYWIGRTGGDTTIIGQRLVINDLEAIVVGVAAPHFVGLRPTSPTDVWVPIEAYPTLAHRPDALISHSQWWTRIVTRLPPHATATVDRLDANFREYLRANVRNAAGERLVLTDAARGAAPAREQLRQFIGWLVVLAAATLIFAVINVSTLLMAHLVRRRKEFAIRAALGAKPTALLMLAAVDTLAVLAAAAIISLLLSAWSYPLVGRLVFGETSQLDISPDWHVVSFGLALIVACGLIFGLVALRGAWLACGVAVDVLRAPKFAARPARVTYTALLLQLIAGTILAGVASACVRTVWTLSRESSGVEANKLAIARISITTPSADARRTLATALLDQLRGMPAVEAVSLSSTGPLDSGRTLSDRARLTTGSMSCGFERIEVVAVTGNYFRTLGIMTLAGNGAFADADDHADAIVNASLAARCGGPAAVIGGRLSQFDPLPRDVIGVVADAKYHNLGESPRPLIYIPFRAGAAAFVAEIRADDPRRIVDEFRDSVDRGEAHVHVTSISTATSRIAASIAAVRTLNAATLAVTMIALILVVLGAYGLAARALANRSQECAVRLSLGAARASLFLLLSRPLTLLTLAGFVIGSILAIPTHALIRASTSLGLLPVSTTWSVAAGLLVMLSGLAGSLLPLARLAELDAVQVLREV